MKCVILQPSYIPWRGFFHQIQKADLFIFYDDVQYDDHGWRNRNRIKSPNGPEWITIPALTKGAHRNKKSILEIDICWDRNWNEAHLKSILQNYAKAPFFDRYRRMVEAWYATRPTRLADFTIETAIQLARELGIAHTRFLRSSSLACNGAKTDRLLEILLKVGASHYISGPSAQGYLETDKLEAHGITVEWMVYDYPEYPQLYPPYDPQVSILDLLFMVGPAAGDYIWAGDCVSAQKV
jgi:hypothetical protein